jgi:hypothetical protein
MSYRATSLNSNATLMTLPLATLAVILEGAGVLLATTGICGAAGITAAVYERKSPEETDRWFQIGAAVGFTVGIPLTIVSFILLQRSL